MKLRHTKYQDQIFYSGWEMAHFKKNWVRIWRSYLAHWFSERFLEKQELSAKFLHAFMNFGHKMPTPTWFRKLAGCCCCEPRPFQMFSASTVPITLAFNIKKSEISLGPKLHMLILLHHHNIITLKFWFCVVRFLWAGVQTFTFCLLFCLHRSLFSNRKLTHDNKKLQNIVWTLYFYTTVAEFWQFVHTY